MDSFPILEDKLKSERKTNQLIKKGKKGEQIKHEK
jgi:hypothetical protein